MEVELISARTFYNITTLAHFRDVAPFDRATSDIRLLGEPFDLSDKIPEDNV